MQEAVLLPCQRAWETPGDLADLHTLPQRSWGGPTMPLLPPAGHHVSSRHHREFWPLRTGAPAQAPPSGASTWWGWEGPRLPLFL